MRNNYGQVTFNLSSDVIVRLDDWRDSQVVPPSRTAVVARAIENFLDDEDRKKGLYPR